MTAIPHEKEIRAQLAKKTPVREIARNIGVPRTSLVNWIRRIKDIDREYDNDDIGARWDRAMEIVRRRNNENPACPGLSPNDVVQHCPANGGIPAIQSNH